MSAVEGLGCSGRPDRENQALAERMSLAVLAAGHAETTAANCAVIIDATARVTTPCSRPWRSSMASAPMQASGPNIGVTTAPWPAAWAATVVAWPLRQAEAVALSAVRESGPRRAMVSGRYPCAVTANNWSPAPIQRMMPVASRRSAAWANKGGRAVVVVMRDRAVHSAAAAVRSVDG